MSKGKKGKISKGRQNPSTLKGFWKISIVALSIILIAGLMWGFKASSVGKNNSKVHGPELTPKLPVLVCNSKNEWIEDQFKNVDNDQEFIHDDNLFYIHPNGVVEMAVTVAINKLADTDRVFNENNYREPKLDDVIRLAGSNGKTGRHLLLRHLHSDTKFYFQGLEYRATTDSGTDSLRIASTGRMIAKVTNTFKAKASEVIDLTFKDEQGKESTLTATSEHPFFVPAHNVFVKLGELKTGMELLTENGSKATVISLERREEDFDVYNIEVDGPQNYYVASADGGTAVLVHNKARPRDPLKLPSNAHSTKNVNEAFGRLEKHCGIDPKLSSARLHKIKDFWNLGPADDVIFDFSGGVYDSNTKELLGSLTQGGAKFIR